MKPLIALSLFAGLGLAMPRPAEAQAAPTAAPAARPAAPLSAADRHAVVAALAEQLRQRYVFPDLGERLARQLLKKDRQGGYDQATDAATLARALTADLRGADGHLHVRYAPDYVADAEAPPASVAERRAEAAREGFGLGRVERLDGNVGHLEILGFGDPDAVAEALSAAVGLLDGTDAMIIDLRRNHGGEPESVAHLMGHFFPAGKGRHLVDLHTRRDTAVQQFWSSTTVGLRYDKPVYVLTSKRTFSAGEECAHDFQAQKRGLVVGEATGGAANPGDFFPMGHDFIVFVPTERAVDPVTGDNWEHKGVQPDVAVPASDALRTAQLAALRQLRAAADGDRAEELGEAIEALEAATPAAATPPAR